MFLAMKTVRIDDTRAVCEAVERGVVLHIKAILGASRSKVVGMQEGHLKETLAELGGADAA